MTNVIKICLDETMQKAAWKIDVWYEIESGFYDRV